MLLRAMRDAALVVLGLEAIVTALAMGGLLFVVARSLGKSRKGLRRLLRRAAKRASAIGQGTTAFAHNPLSLLLPLVGLIFGLGHRAWPWLRRFRRLR